MWDWLLDRLNRRMSSYAHLPEGVRQALQDLPDATRAEVQRRAELLAMDRAVPLFLAMLAGFALCVAYQPVAVGSILVVLPLAAALSFGRALANHKLAVRRYRRAYAQLGLIPTACLRCGFDLRHSEGHCPECGEAAV